MTKGDLLPEFVDVLTLDDQALDLTGCTVQFTFRNTLGTVSKTGTGIVTNATTGAVKYVWVAGDTDEIGKYIGKWIVTYPDSRKLNVPSEGYIEFEIEPGALADANILAFVPFIRTMLGDNHPTIHQYRTEAIKDAVRLVLNMGQIPTVTLTADQNNTSVALSPISEEATVRLNWSRVVLYASMRFVVPNSASSSYRMRAISESFGESKHQVFEMLKEVYELENGIGGE